MLKYPELYKTSQNAMGFNTKVILISVKLFIAYLLFHLQIQIVDYFLICSIWPFIVVICCYFDCFPFRVFVFLLIALVNHYLLYW